MPVRMLENAKKITKFVAGLPEKGKENTRTAALERINKKLYRGVLESELTESRIRNLKYGKLPLFPINRSGRRVTRATYLKEEATRIRREGEEAKENEMKGLTPEMAKKIDNLVKNVTGTIYYDKNTGIINELNLHEGEHGHNRVTLEFHPHYSAFSNEGEFPLYTVKTEGKEYKYNKLENEVPGHTAVKLEGSEQFNKKVLQELNKLTGMHFNKHIEVEDLSGFDSYTNESYHKQQLKKQGLMREGYNGSFAIAHPYWGEKYGNALSKIQEIVNKQRASKK